MRLEMASYPQNVDRLVGLFEACFHRPLDPAYLMWRYGANPVGELLVDIEEAGGTVVANYSASPVVMMVGGQAIKAGMSMTTMTHPSHAGKGLFTTLAARLYEDMRVRGYGMVWGFPNNQSHRTFASRLAWRDVYEIPTMGLDLDGAAPSADEPGATDDGFERDYPASVPLENGVYVRKDRDYLRWRYRNCPSGRYTNLVIEDGPQVRSFCVVKPFEDGLDLVDMQAASAEDAAALARRAIAHARRLGARRLSAWAPRHHFIHGVYERLGFANRAPITYLGMRILDPALAVSDNYSDWFLQMGDSDVY